MAAVCQQKRSGDQGCQQACAALPPDLEPLPLYKCKGPQEPHASRPRLSYRQIHALQLATTQIKAWSFVVTHRGLTGRCTASRRLKQPCTQAGAVPCPCPWGDGACRGMRCVEKVV